VRLSALVPALRRDPTIRALLGHLADRADDVDVALTPGVRPVFVAALAADLVAAVPTSDDPGPVVLLVTSTNREADETAAALRCLLPPDSVAVFPSWETLPHERLSPRSDTVGRRLAALRRLAHPDPADRAYGPIRVLVAPIRAVLQPFAAGLGDLAPVQARAGDERSLEHLVEGLVGAAYVRTDLVERRGEFAVRGGILDVFPPTEEHPLRVEMWGDTVEEIRWFKVADQRSLEVAEHGLWAPPCRELLLTEEVRAAAARRADDLPGVADLLLKMSEGIAVEGMESLAPVLVDDLVAILDVLPPGSLIVVNDPERVRARAHDLVATSAEFLDASWANAAAGNAVPIDLRSVLGRGSYATVVELRARARGLGLPWWQMSGFTADEDLAAESGRLSLRVPGEEVEAFRGDTDRAVAAIGGYVGAGSTTVVVTEGPGLAARVAEMLHDHDIPARVAGELTDLAPGVVTATSGSLGRGFALPGAGLVVITETDLTGSVTRGTKDMRRMPSRRRGQVDPLQLRTGDLVVHEQHGVGRYVEMMQRAVAGATGVPRHRVRTGQARPSGRPALSSPPTSSTRSPSTSVVRRRRCTVSAAGLAEGEGPGAQGVRRSRRAHQALRRTEASKGTRSGPTRPGSASSRTPSPTWRRPTRSRRIDEVKEDMQRLVPMDRLICGDVGYGKTEIAVRAAFKAVQDGKQVAVLVPTTLLVQQHMSDLLRALRVVPREGGGAVAVQHREGGQGGPRGCR
jgi:transcription-repair coupling factor (superfamily II helicase)